MGDRLVGRLGEVGPGRASSGGVASPDSSGHRGEVLGQLDVGRAGLLERRDPERLADDLGDGLDPLDARVPLRDRLEHPDDVDDLVGLLVELVGARLAGDRDHRRPVEEGVGDAGDEVRRARPERRHRDGGPAGQAAVDVGHERGALLVAGRDVADGAVVAQRVEDVHRLLAGHREDVLAALGREAVDEQVGGAARGRGSVSVIGRHRSPVPSCGAHQARPRCACGAVALARPCAMRPEPERPVARPHGADPRRGAARARHDRHGDPRQGDAPAAPRGRAADQRAGDRVLFPRDVVEAAIASAPRSFQLYDRDGNPHADLGGDRVHFVPGSSGLKWLDHRTGEVRLANSTDFVEYVRLGDGLEHIPYLATAFSTNEDIEAQVSDAWRLYLALTNSKKPIVSGAFTEHGVPRMVEMMQLFRGGPGRPHRPPDVDLHDHRDRQLPVQRGLLPEPHRLRRGGHPGRDRAGHADGPDRAGHDGRARRSSTRSTCWPASPWPRSSGRARRSCSAGRRRRST